jgi:hypothetical protein
LAQLEQSSVSVCVGGSTFTRSMVESCASFVVCFHQITTTIKKISEGRKITRLSRHHERAGACRKKMHIMNRMSGLKLGNNDMAATN